MRMTLACAVAAAAALSAPMVRALTPLHQEPTVRSMFYSIGLADEVRKNCPTIEPRMLRAFTYLKSIETYARTAGYSDDQIRNLTENKAEKEKLRVLIRGDLVRRGASPGDPAGYCRVGAEEIARKSASGRLLREK